MSLCYKTGHGPWGDPGSGGFLGIKHAPFRLVGGNNQTVETTENMVLKGITLDRLQDRRSLLSALDNFRRSADTSGAMDGLDAFTQQAMGILTSSALAEALDLSKEDPQAGRTVRQGQPAFHADGAPWVTENFLIARRLVEAGARVVSLNFSRWDWHGDNFKIARHRHADAGSRGVGVGRGPAQPRLAERRSRSSSGASSAARRRSTTTAGRDHWPQVSCALLAGGGMRTGQVIGATNRLGEYAKERPVTFQEVFATLYHKIGLDLKSVREFDLRGRPQYLVDQGVEPMRELI